MVDGFIQRYHSPFLMPQNEQERTKLSALDICTGAGGEAVGLEAAGFMHEAVAEIDSAACQTLRLNRPAWRVIEGDIREINGLDFRGIDLLAGGVPCPPFTIAGKQLGADDERDLFPEALRLIEQAKSAAVMLENVPGFASEKFAAGIAPTLVGGSKKHGGPDLGPTRARKQWEALGVDGKGIADAPPGEDFPVDALPRLTLSMTARIQAFPDSWIFAGGKTAAYRQIGNAFPPPVSEAVGKAILAVLMGQKQGSQESKPSIFQPLLLHKKDKLYAYPRLF